MDGCAAKREDADLRDFLRDSREQTATVIAAWACERAARDHLRSEEIQRARGPVDHVAERVVLTAAARGRDLPAGLPPKVRPEHFGDLVHRPLARAIDLMRLARLSRSSARREQAQRDLDAIDELALPEVAGYVAGLLRAEPPCEGELAMAIDIVLDLAARRRALSLAAELHHVLLEPASDARSLIPKLRALAAAIEV